VEDSIERVATLEFSSERKTMSTLVTGYNGNQGNTTFLKGAADRVLDKSSHVSLAGEFHELTKSDRA